MNGEKKIQVFDLEEVKYDKNIVYKIFEENKSADDIIIEINKILSLYDSSTNDIFNDLLENIVEKNLLHEELLINLIHEKINKNNSILFNVIKNYKESKNYLNLIKILCCLIDFDDTSFFVINELSFLLNEINNMDKTDKKSIIELLMYFYNNSKKPRAKNIFLNEAEILQQKTILESKPRVVDVTVTSKCNLKCIMCNGTKNR